MLPHAFSHDGATYVVSFKPIGDQWRAALYKRDDASITELSPVAADDLIGLSDRAAGAMVGEASSGSASPEARSPGRCRLIPNETTCHPSRI